MTECGEAICENMARDNIGTDGLLPTHLFRRLFIHTNESNDGQSGQSVTPRQLWLLQRE